MKKKREIWRGGGWMDGGDCLVGEGMGDQMQVDDG